VTILIVSAVEAERDAATRHLEPSGPISVGHYAGTSFTTAAGPVHAFGCGVGPVAAAITTATLLAREPSYDVVVNAGIAGGFKGRVAIGDIVLGNLSTFADLGARTDDAFLTVRDMGFPQDSSLALGDQRLIDRISAARQLASGEVLTLACMTGTEPDAQELARRYPRALAEAMEGFAVISATGGYDNVRFVAEVRAISNIIGRRDRSTWNIPLAFDALAEAVSALLGEELLEEPRP
jgi:futalosine hydrolase